MGRKKTGQIDRIGRKYRARLGSLYLGLFDTEAEAKLNIRVALQMASEKKPETLASFAEKWFQQRELDGAVRRIEKQRSDWSSRVATAKFIDWPLKRIKPQHIQAWLSDLGRRPARYVINRKVDGKIVSEFHDRSTPLSYESIAKALSLLKLCLDHAIVCGKLEIGKNPARVVKMPRRRPVAVKGAQRVVHLTAPEISALFRLQMPPRDRAVYALAIYAGLRRSELWGLRWEHVVLDTGKPHVRVRHSYSEPCKSPDAVRDVPLLAPAREALKAYRRSLKPRPIGGLVFPADGGGCHSASYDCRWTDHRGYRHGPRSNNKKQRVWPGWRSKAGIRPEVTFHALRHTCGCHLAQGSWVPNVVSRPFALIEIKEWLGHSSIEVTERHYVDFMPDNLHAAVHGPKRKSKRKARNDDTSK